MPLSIGLGKNSPIPIETSPDKYEGLIVRHGQWVRWSIAKKCSCLLENNRPDARCSFCHGSGWDYRFQETEEDPQVLCTIVDSETIELPLSYTGATVSSVFLPTGQALKVNGVFGRWIKVSGSVLSTKGSAYACVSVSRIKKVPEDSAVYAGFGVVKLSKYEYQNPWASIPYDLVSLETLTRADGSTLNVLSWSVDKIVIDTTVNEPLIGEPLRINASYMPPFRMAVLNQNLSYSDRNALQEIGGDSIVVLPFSYKVGEYDTITAWISTQIRKKIIQRTELEDVDFLPDLFVSDIMSISTTDGVFTEGVDFVLWDRNSVRWLTANRPAPGAYYSIEYSANVSYRVIQQMPNIRSSENKRFPSRVAVKLIMGTSGADQV